MLIFVYLVCSRIGGVFVFSADDPEINPQSITKCLVIDFMSTAVVALLSYLR